MAMRSIKSQMVLDLGEVSTEKQYFECITCGYETSLLRGGMCPECSQEPESFSLTIMTDCDVCGTINSKHIRCTKCSLLIGPKHYAKHISAAGMCPQCELESSQRPVKRIIRKAC